jgi:hypothetical protein
MGKKIGPNEPCPCGSGKKYKKCHRAIDEETGLSSGAGGMLRKFQSYDRKQLIGVLSRVQSRPRAQAWGVRLERAVQVAVSLAYAGGGAVDSTGLENCLNSDPDLARLMKFEDPVCGFFTSNLTFHGGNYTVYEGIGQGSVDILRHMLRGVLGAFPFPDAVFKRRAILEARAVLHISDHLARTNGHASWLEASSEPGERISIHATDVEQWQAGVLSAATLADNGVALATLAPFLFEPGSIATSALRGEGDPLTRRHPLDARPLVRIGDDILVAEPCGLAPALRHRLLISAREAGLLKEVLAGYWASVEKQGFGSLLRMGYTEIDAPSGLSDPPDDSICRDAGKSAAFGA